MLMRVDVQVVRYEPIFEIRYGRNRSGHCCSPRTWCPGSTLLLGSWRAELQGRLFEVGVDGYRRSWVSWWWMVLNSSTMSATWLAGSMPVAMSWRYSRSYFGDSNQRSTTPLVCGELDRLYKSLAACSCELGGVQASGTTRVTDSMVNQGA